MHELPFIKNSQRTKLKCPDSLVYFTEKAIQSIKTVERGKRRQLKEREGHFLSGEDTAKIFCFKRNSKSRKIVNNSEIVK